MSEKSTLDAITTSTIRREGTYFITNNEDISLVLLQASGTATLNDMFVLGTCTLFQNRVQPALLQTCSAISSEGGTVPYHAGRDALAVSIVTPGNLTNFVNSFTQLISSQSGVINLATAAASNYTALTIANVNTQQALVTDTTILNTISAVFNTYVTIN